MKYDKEFKLNINDKTVDVGIIKGNNLIVVILPGQDSNIYGFNNRYLKLSKRINDKYKASIIIFSNPFQLENPTNGLMDIINDYATRFDYYHLYFLGVSKGALIGAQYITLNKKFQRIALVNPPLIINTHKTIDGVNSFRGERIDFVYGSLDPSFKYVELLTLRKKDNLNITVLNKMDHNITDEHSFLKIVDNTLFLKS